MARALIAIVFVSLYGNASLTFAASPREALLEIVLAEKPEDVEKHLPMDLVEVIATLKEPARGRFRAQMLPRRQVPENGEIIRTQEGDDLVLKLIPDDADSNNRMELRIGDEFISGTNALLQLTWCRGSDCSNFYAHMKYQAQEWRLAQAEISAIAWDLEKQAAILKSQRSVVVDNEEKALSSLHSIYFALSQYEPSEDDPNAEFPRELNAVRIRRLGERTGNMPVLDAGIACENSPCHSAGYVFKYLVNRNSDGTQAYAVTAQPEEFGRTGTRSFFLDESGTIRFTEQDREASIEDTPVR